MKKVLVLVAIVAVFSFATVAMAFPSLPDDLNIGQPDTSLPTELKAFVGKWERKTMYGEFFLVIEKIEQGKAILYTCSSVGGGWDRVVAEIVCEYGRWKIYFHGRAGLNILSLRGKKLDLLDLYVPPLADVTFLRVS